MEKYYKKLRSLVQILRYLCPFESSQMEFSMDFLRWNFPSGGSSIYQILRNGDENSFEPSTCGSGKSVKLGIMKYNTHILRHKRMKAYQAFAFSHLLGGLGIHIF